MELEQARAERRGDEAEQVWSAGGQHIILGDSLPGLRRLKAGSIDVCVTSPPYNIGVAYKSHNDRMPKASYLDWMHEVGKELNRVLAPSGSFFLNVGSTSVDPWIAFEVARAFATSFELQNHIVWVKSVSIGADTFGHFKPISSNRFLNNNHESIFHFTKVGNVSIDRLSIGVPFKDKSNISRWGHKKDLRCAGNVWFMPYKTVKSRAQKFDHPSGFPVELPMRCIQMHGKPDVVVLDPFLGAGTTLIAAERLGASGIGFEIDPTYAGTARVRVQSEVDACQKTKSRS